jgi:hypothetical protein
MTGYLKILQIAVKVKEDNQIRNCNKKQDNTEYPNGNRKVEFEVCSNLYGRYFRWIYTTLRYI